MGDDEPQVDELGFEDEVRLSLDRLETKLSATFKVVHAAAGDQLSIGRLLRTFALCWVALEVIKALEEKET